ncbi:Hermansky-Pudlak Syndrome 5 Protein [Manis pentadactyla]|nr:Hermansky-Pudlak Syndrome 5 Protein [Manis pentadactyla]
MWLEAVGGKRGGEGTEEMRGFPEKKEIRGQRVSTLQWSSCLDKGDSGNHEIRVQKSKSIEVMEQTKSKTKQKIYI